MRVCLRGRASQVLLWGALIITAVSSQGPVVVEAQAPAMRWDGLIELVSGKNEFPPPNLNPPIPADGPSQMSRHAVSGDGRYVVFTATAPALAGYYGPALYIRDRRLSDTRVLFAGATTTGLRDAVISEDGRHVAFTVCEPWMRPDYAQICDVWTIDLLTGRTAPLSVAPDSGDFGNADSDEPVLSRDGRFLVFRTAATNLVQGILAGVPQLVIRDRDPDRNGIYDEPGPLSPNSFQMVSVPKGNQGTVPGNGPSATADVSENGRYVAFRSAASNLVPGDTNGAWDVFRRDRQARDTRRLNVRPAGDQSPYPIDSSGISMTPDARYVAFASADPVLAPASFGDSNNARDVFVFDAQSLNLQRIDVGWLPYPNGPRTPGSGPTEWPTLTADGRYISVQSAAMNVEMPPPPNSTHSYVFDRFTNAVTRISIKPDGTDPDHSCIQPQISADGSLVTFVSQAFNLTPNVYTDSDRVYAAVHFEITPEEQSVSGGAGGSATYNVITQQHTPWWIDWTEWQPWIDFETPPMGFGNGMLKIKANQANPSPTPRTATIKIFEKSVRFIQLEGLSLTSVSPITGPDTGGTEVTFTGTGFEPGMRVVFDGLDATSIQFVNSTTFIATTPSHAPGAVWVGVFSAADSRFAWIDNAFRYTDTKPPQIFYGFSESPNENGWFNRNVTLYWAWMDNETPVTSTSGCDATVIVADTPGTTYTCTATSEGGTSSLSAFVKRDATAPTATITSPQSVLYDLNEVVQPAFTCSDALSGIASCLSGTNGQPVDTSMPGYHTFGVSMTDRAGNPGWASVDYAVGSGVCAQGLPDNVGWWRMEGDTLNTRSNGTTAATRVGLTSDVYVDAVVGQGYQFAGPNGYLQTPFAYNFLGGIRKFGIAAWVKPSANTVGTIIRSREAYSLARLANGSVAWAFRKTSPSGLSYYDTGVKLPLDVWSHVVVVLDNTVVRTYLNGRLAHTATEIGTVYATSNYGITLGGADDRPDYFKGVLDELQLFQNGLNDAQVEQLFLAGSAGACVPKRTSFQIVEPIPASFGSPTYAFDVRLVDQDGLPVVGRTLELLSQVGAWPYSSSYATVVTDGDGRVHWDAPLKNAPRGLYEEFTGVTFLGDADYVRQYTEPDVLVGKGNPVITWPAPAPITYSFPVNGTQLNATASMPGTFSYSPPSGTLLPAGDNSLSVTFTPTDAANYNTVTATNTITVNKATPNVLIEAAGTWPYTGTPRAVVGKVKDRFNIVIATPTVTYDGSPDPPVMPGTYTVVATFPGNANYLAGTATETLTITKSVVDIQINVQNATYDGAPHAAGYLISGIYPDTLPADSVTYNGSENTPVNAGTYTVVVTFNGTALYQAATASKTFTISKATAVLAWSRPVTIVYGTPLGGDQLNATSNVFGSFDYSPAAGTVLNAGASQALTATFTPADPANYNGGTVNTTIDVSKAVAEVTAIGGTFTYNGQPHTASGFVTGLAGASLGTPSFTYSGSSQPPVTVGTYEVVASFAGNANYQPASATTAIVILQATAILGWEPVQPIVYGTALGEAQLQATANIAGTFTYSPAAGTVLSAGAHVLTARFTPNDPNYSSDGIVNTAIDVSKATATVTATGGTFTYDGQPHPATGSVTGLDGISLGTPSFTYNGSAQPPVAAGSYAVVASFAGNANYESASASATITIGKASVVLTWNQPAAIVYGTPLGAIQLNASSNVPGTFAYSPAAGTVLAAGSGRALTATFTPADGTNYTGASVNTTITVAAAPLSIRANDSAKPFGAPLPPFTASAAGFVNGDTFASLGGALAFSTSATAQSAVGTYPVAPSGLSSPNYVITFVNGSLNVVRGQVTVAVSTSPAPSGLNQPMMFTANVIAAAPATGTPGGIVRFFDGATLLGSNALTSGSASLTTAGLAAGGHTIQVTYDGDASFETGSGSASHTVNSAAATPSITIASNRNPSSVGQSVTLTANLTMTTGSVSGTVQFYDGAALLGTASIVSGSATFTTTAFAAGSHAITVRYLGSTTAPPAISGVFVQAVGASGWKNRTSSSTLSASPNPSAIGAGVTLTANITGSNGTPTGAVLFMVNGQVVGGPVTLTAISGSTAQAMFVLPGLTGGRHVVTATYLGNSNYKGSTATATQTVN